MDDYCDLINEIEHIPIADAKGEEKIGSLVRWLEKIGGEDAAMKLKCKNTD